MADSGAKGSGFASDLLLTISGEELLESGELLWEDGVEERSASSTYFGFWMDFFRALLVGVRDSSSSSTSLGGAFFFLGERVVNGHKLVLYSLHQIYQTTINFAPVLSH